MRCPLMEHVKPQLAHRGNGFGASLLDDPAYVGEEKLDGLRIHIHVVGHRTNAVYSRTGKPLTGPGLDWLWAVAWKVESAVLDGEVCGPHGTVASDVTHLIHEGDRVELAIFDNLVLAGQSIMRREYRFRRAVVEEIARVQDHPQIRATRMSADKRALLAAVGAVGGEGIVMKRLNSPYVPGSRTQAWVKLHCPERDRTYDVIATGYTTRATYSREAFKTGEAALTYGVWDPVEKKIMECGQLPYIRSIEELKRLIGTVVTATAKYQFPGTGALRHAHVVRFRNDKPIRECVAPKDEA